ncbi:uncharacterized protein LOC133795929 [Humulus lupulus]|uniref:uncharacterized protein LOC133795929 n=1 Tax=Humulus lupulus TaxID=3486 RepID=UPI002B40972B|nr:uncharacterized protein LOC133795929 [Humulus lupulus]
MVEYMDVIPTKSIGGSPRTLALTTKNQSSRDQPVQVLVPTVPVSNNEKLEKFTSVNFKTWKQKIVYSVMKTAKELWDSLDHKYKVEDAGAKKFLVGQFLNFKMVDSKNVISQVQDLQLIIHGIQAERMVFSSSFQVVAIIEKLPPAWLDFKNYLKRKEMSVEDLIRRLRIEEDNKSVEK